MKKTEVEIKGQEELAEIGRNMARENIGDRLSETIVEIAFVLEGGIKEGITKLGAVDTGFMRASTRLNEVGRRSARVGPNADYSWFVHEGKGTNRFKGPRPFLDVGVALSGDAMDKVMERTGQKIAVNIVKT